MVIAVWWQKIGSSTRYAAAMITAHLESLILHAISITRFTSSSSAPGVAIEDKTVGLTTPPSAAASLAIELADSAQPLFLLRFRVARLATGLKVVVLGSCRKFLWWKLTN